jgi:predicted DNA-binding protein with PD1-like motif
MPKDFAPTPSLSRQTDEAMDCLRRFARKQKLGAAQLMAIGAFSPTVIAYFDWGSKKYLRHALDEQMEVASFTGDVALGPDGEPTIHAHLVLGQRDGTAMAGPSHGGACAADAGGHCRRSAHTSA